MSTPAQTLKAHLPTEINTAKTYLNQYRSLYLNDYSDTGLIYLLVGYNNYLNSQVSGAAVTPAQLYAAGFI